MAGLFAKSAPDPTGGTQSTDETPAAAASFAAVMAYGAERAFPLELGKPEVQRLVADDAVFLRVNLDPFGLSTSARTAILAPIKPVFAEWHRLRGGFDSALGPKLAVIEHVEGLQRDIDKLIAKRDEAVAERESSWEKEIENPRLKEQLQHAKERYNQTSLEHRRREPNMRATSIWYWVAILAITITECLINYDTFLLFTGIPALAAGATLILAALLGFAAHWHGELFKQWPYLLGRFQKREHRAEALRRWGMSTFFLCIVLIAAGGSRYAAAVRNIVQVALPNLVGGDLTSDTNPLRDVLISLLANVAAWGVGVFISYTCHDVDPDYMNARAQFDRADLAYNKKRRILSDDVQQILHRAQEDIKGKENEAAVRAMGIEAETGMLGQVRAHEARLFSAFSTAFLTNAGYYRDMLSRLAIEQAGKVQLYLVRPDGEMAAATPFDLRSMAPQVDPADFPKLLV